MNIEEFNQYTPYGFYTHSYMIRLLSRHGLLPTDDGHPELPNSSLYAELGYKKYYSVPAVNAYLGY